MTYPLCKDCWHYRREHCGHPDAERNDYSHARVSGMAFAKVQRNYDCGHKGRRFLQRPPLLYRLRHLFTWRRARFAVMALQPPSTSEYAQPLTGQASQAQVGIYRTDKLQA